jgi:hypothetical protein
MEALCHSQTRAREAERAAKLRRSTFLSSSSDKPRNFLPISSGSNCCSWKPFIFRLRIMTRQFPPYFLWSLRGRLTKEVGNSGKAGRRLPRGEESSEGDPDMISKSTLLLLH